MEEMSPLEAEVRARVLEAIARDLEAGALPLSAEVRRAFPGHEALVTAVLAEVRFARWREAHERGDAEEFAAVLAAHPDEADALAALHDAWLRPGDQDGPGDTVEVGAGGAGTTSWDAFLDQLRSRGPAFERYVFEGEVARGGMGAIHRVFDQDARRRLALKVMLGERSATPADSDASLGRFLEEAQVASQLDHPGIVPVHEIGIDAADRVYFTMKLVKGEDLRSVFDRVADPSDEEWTTTRALNVMLRVCEAMAYAHEKGVIHRDLKPGNVMVGKFGEAYVMDWGLAKVLGREDAHDLRLRLDVSDSLRTARGDAAEQTPDSPILTMDGAVVGTPAYMPPEQACGRIEELGPPADVYAVGAMLYHLLAHGMPYTKPGDRISARTILALVTQGPPPSLAGLAPDASSELVAIVEKAMAREIADRYPDMTALARDLRAYLENRVVAAYETGAWAELKKWVQRNKALALTAAAAMFVVAALGTWSNVTIRDQRNVAEANEQEATKQRDRADENADEAKQRAEEAEEARLQAEAERDRVLRLSDKRRLDVLVADADALWPAHPENVEGLKGWLLRASDLLGNLPLHEATLAEVRATGTPQADPGDAELATLREHVARHAAGEEVEGEEDAFGDEDALAGHVATLEKAIGALDAATARRRGYEFGDGEEARWWHDAVKDLVVGLHALKADDVHGPTVAGIGARLAWAETVAEETMTGPEVAAKWGEARAAIREHPRYDGLDLAPQVGLVPLGPDPDSTLWEFGHPQTGDVPVRAPDTGNLAIGEETGLVFVLIPGGTYRIGAEKDDPEPPHFDPQADSDESPVHDVPLSPYLLSKYEMTQGQWARFTGENPSFYRPKSARVQSLRHPVERVSWETCRQTLDRLGLVLPTETQWEAACRAGTETPWSTGREKRSLEGFANLADQAAKRAGAPWTSIADWPELDDGFPIHAPVGSFRANGFGLHDMHGNVWEWCRDGYLVSAYERIAPTEGDGLRAVPGASGRVTRGGGYAASASNARSSNRSRDTPEDRDVILGLRPARFCD